MNLFKSLNECQVEEDRKLVYRMLNDSIAEQITAKIAKKPKKGMTFLFKVEIR